MRKTTLRARTACLLLLAAVSGCVELTGQRIAWFHDVAKDELRILLFYDGVHESANNTQPNGAEQIPKFVADGDVMLLDWYGHINMDDEQKKLDDPSVPELDRDWARLITSIKVEPVGHYREPDGRVGAAQLITIPKVSEFLGKLNGLINRELLRNATAIAEGSSLARTRQRIRAAARQGHQWAALDGQAIRVTIPVHPGEWAREKAKGLSELARHVADALADGAEEQQRRDLRSAVQLLTSLPVSYLDRGDAITIVVGTAKRSGTLRATIRDEYEPSLEKVLVENVKTDLDAELGAAELNQGAKPLPGIVAIRDFGPPEEPVRALLCAASSGPEKRKAALEGLRARAAAFNRDRGVPPAPEDGEDPEKYLAAWKEWYGQMKRYPLPAKEGL